MAKLVVIGNYREGNGENCVFCTGGMRGRFCLYLYIRGVGVGGLVRGSVRGILVKRFGALMDCEWTVQMWDKVACGSMTWMRKEKNLVASVFGAYASLNFGARWILFSMPRSVCLELNPTKMKVIIIALESVIQLKTSSNVSTFFLLFKRSW